jgi:hypothetical protein
MMALHLEIQGNSRFAEGLKVNSLKSSLQLLRQIMVNTQDHLQDRFLETRTTDDKAKKTNPKASIHLRNLCEKESEYPPQMRDRK